VPTRQPNRPGQGTGGVTTTRSALGFAQTLGGATDRCDVPTVEVAQLHTVHELHAVALPVEAIGEENAPLGARRNVGQIDRGHDLVAQTEIELIRVGLGEGMGLPRRHGVHLGAWRGGAHVSGRRYTSLPVKTTCEAHEGNKVVLSVEIDEADFSRDIDAALSKIGRDLRLPGFRQGKAPRKVLEARIGLEAARGQALQDSIPQYLARAVRENDVDIIATPEIEVTGGHLNGPVTFTATCEVRPVVTVPGYAGLRVEIDAPTVSDTDIDDVVTAELRRQGTLTDVSRPAGVGDFVVVDLVGSRGGEPVAGLAVDDWSYEIGKKWVSPEFDDKLTGASAGAELTFTDTPNGTEEPADFVVKVTSVQELVVPDLTDEWVAANVEGFDTIAAWKESVAERMTDARWNQVRNSLVEKVTDALVELVSVDAPESMVSADLQRRVQNVVRQFASQGMDLEQWLQATGQEPATLIESFRPASLKAAKVDLALRAVVEAEGLHADDNDVERELAGIADRSNDDAIRQQMMSGSKKKPKLITVDQVRAAYQANDALVDLAAEISKSKALDWLVHNVTFVDPSGATLDSDTVVGLSAADQDLQHDNDHDPDEADS